MQLLKKKAFKETNELEMIQSMKDESKNLSVLGKIESIFPHSIESESRPGKDLDEQSRMGKNISKTKVLQEVKVNVFFQFQDINLLSKY